MKLFNLNLKYLRAFLHGGGYWTYSTYIKTLGKKDIVFFDKFLYFFQLPYFYIIANILAFPFIWVYISFLICKKFYFIRKKAHVE